jgi:hypothetical protein
MVISLIALLYRFDHDSSNLDTLKQFIINEYTLCYPDKDELVQMCDSSDSVSGLLTEYKEFRKSIEFEEQSQYIEIADDADELYEALLPADLTLCNSYIRPYIYTNAIYDIQAFVNTKSDNYYEIQYNMLSDLRLHEVYLYRNVYKFIYCNVNRIIGILIWIIAILFSTGIVILMRYYYEYVHYAKKRSNPD